MRSILAYVVLAAGIAVAAPAAASVSLTDLSHITYNVSTDYSGSDVGAVAGESAGATTWAVEISGTVQATTLHGQTTADANMVANFTFAALSLENTNTQVFPYAPGTPAMLPTAQDSNNTNPNCVGRSVVYPPFGVGGLGLSVVRKTYVPQDASFARQLTLLTNTTASSTTFSAVYDGSYNESYSTQGSTQLHIYGPQASGAAAGLLSSSSSLAPHARWLVAANVADANALLVNTARVGLVWDGQSGSVGASGVNLALPAGFMLSSVQSAQLGYNYPLTIAPGQTVALMQYVTVAPTVAAAMSQSEALAGRLDAAALECLTATELTQIANFCVTSTCLQAEESSTGGSTGGSTGTVSTTGGTTSTTGGSTSVTTKKKGCSAGGGQTLGLLVAAAAATAAAGRRKP